MRRALLLAVTTILLIGTLAPAGANARPHEQREQAVACASAHGSVQRGAIRRSRLATMCLINRIRARAGLPRLRHSAKLTRVARRHSRDMVRARYFAHESRSGASPFQRMLRSGYVPRDASWYLGENLGWGSGSNSSPASLVRMWMRSPGHRANILSRRFREVGIGIARGVPVGGAHASRAGGATYTTDFGYHS